MIKQVKFLMRRRNMFTVCVAQVILDLTLVDAGRRVWSPARSRQSWRSSGPIGTCCPASGPGEQLSASGCTRRRSPFASCSNALPVPWLCHGTSARASSSREKKKSRWYFIRAAYCLARLVTCRKSPDGRRKNIAIKRGESCTYGLFIFASFPLCFTYNLCGWYNELS